MGEIDDLLRIHAMPLLQALDTREDRLLGRGGGGDLEGEEAPGLLIHQQQIGEGAADIDAEPVA